MSSLFSKFSLQSPRGALQLANRIFIAPMCQYSAENGSATDWHFMHWGNMLNSGAGAFTIEATAVSPEGRISPKCLGLWDQNTENSIKDKLNRARQLAPHMPVIIQLAHAGRKGSTAVPWHGGLSIENEHDGGWETIAPSSISMYPHEKRPPKAATIADMNKIISDFVSAAQRADSIGVDGIEIHAAHGYLLHEFLSPVSNKRTDEYGGSFLNRIRFPMEVFSAVRKSYKGVLGLRLSATDWVDNGWTPEECVQYVKALKDQRCDFIHVSSGGISAEQKIKIGSNYQVPFAKLIKDSVDIPVIAVGLITEPSQADQIISSGSADFVALARGMLYNPRWGWQAAAALHGQVTASPQYWRCPPRGSESIFDYSL